MAYLLSSSCLETWLFLCFGHLLCYVCTLCCDCQGGVHTTLKWSYSVLLAELQKTTFGHFVLSLCCNSVIVFCIYACGRSLYWQTHNKQAKQKCNQKRHWRSEWTYTTIRQLTAQVLLPIIIYPSIHPLSSTWGQVVVAEGSAR